MFREAFTEEQQQVERRVIIQVLSGTMRYYLPCTINRASICIQNAYKVNKFLHARLTRQMTLTGPTARGNSWESRMDAGFADERLRAELMQDFAFNPFPIADHASITWNSLGIQGQVRSIAMYGLVHDESPQKVVEAAMKLGLWATGIPRHLSFKDVEARTEIFLGLQNEELCAATAIQN